MLALLRRVGNWFGRGGVRALDDPGDSGSAKPGNLIRLNAETNHSIFDLDLSTVVYCGEETEVSADFPVHAHHVPDHGPARARRQGPAVLSNLLRSAKNIGIGLLFATTSLYGQGGYIQIFQAQAPATSAQFNNTNPKFNAWTVMYNYSGSGSFSVELDCAPDMTTAGGAPTPGSFAACTNVVTGNNPSTTPAYGYMTFVGYTPWLQLNVTAISSGNLTVVAVAFDPADPESGGGSGGGCTGTAATPCIVAGPNASGAAPTKNPVLVAGQDGTDVRTVLTDASGRPNVNLFGFNGTAASQILANTAAAAISLSAGTDVVIVSGVSAKTTYILKMDVAWNNSANVTIRQGTTSSTPCDTSTVALTGAYQNLLGLSEDYNSNFSLLKTSSTNLDICLHFSTAVTAGGQVFYAQF